VSAPLPPAHLVRRVSGVRPESPYHRALGERAAWHDVHDPLGTNEEIGRRCADALRAILPAGWSFEGKRVLDFGCGSGRTLRHLIDEAAVAEVHGCDIDEPSIRWLHEHYAPRFQLAVNGEEPPLPYPAEHFDLVWAVSVFTHLTDSWSRWLVEIRRVLRPGGLFVATFAGSGYAVALADPPWCEEWDENRIGMNALLPAAPWEEGGPAVFHSRWWLAEHWGRAFEILETRADGLAAVPGLGQGILLLRKDERGDVTAAELEAPSDDPREFAALRHNRAQLAREIKGLAQQIDALGEHASALATERDHSEEWRRDAVRRFEDAQDAYRALRGEYEALERLHASHGSRHASDATAERRLAQVTSSRSWRWTAPLRAAGGAARRLAGRAR
jgi:SAM-dependent methyltransferase